MTEGGVLLESAVDLSGHLGTLHAALDLVSKCPTTEPLRLSLEDVKKLLPTDIVHFCLLLEIVRGMGFPEVVVEAPKPSFLGVYLWRIGLWDLFPEYAPRRPIHEPGRGSNDRCVELTRFTDLAGAFELGERLPHVLTSARGAADVAGGLKTLKRLSSAVFEIAENTAAHSCRLRPGARVIGYYMAQRMPRVGRTFIALGDVGDGIPNTHSGEVRDRERPGGAAVCAGARGLGQRRRRQRPRPSVRGHREPAWRGDDDRERRGIVAGARLWAGQRCGIRARRARRPGCRSS